MDEDDQRGVTHLMNEMATDARMELWWIQMRLSAKAKKQAAPTDDEIVFAKHRTQKAQQGERDAPAQLRCFSCNVIVLLPRSWDQNG